MVSDAQKKASKKYREKMKRLTIDFSPADAELWEHVSKQPRKQTFIKDLIRENMKKEENL